MTNQTPTVKRYLHRAVGILGLILMAVGFYEVSIWNTAPSEPWGIWVFGIGALFVAVALILIIPSLFFRDPQRPWPRR
jgi:hypothetical protein